MEYIDFKMKTHFAADEIAALIVEPVQGEGGFIVPPKKFFPELKKMAEENDIIFIADEIQTGFGRTGKMFAMEHFGVTPDIMTFAKSLAAGMPLSGIIGKAEIIDSVHPGGLGGTYGGNPVACAAALKTIDIIEETIPNAVKMGELMHRKFKELQSEIPQIGDVRGLGPMIAIELVKDPDTQEPAPEETLKIVKQSLQSGLIVIKAGVYGNVLRILVPIAAPLDVVEEGMEILGNTIKQVFS